MVKFSVLDLEDFKWDSNEREREESEGIKGEIRGKIKNKTIFSCVSRGMLERKQL